MAHRSCPLRCERAASGGSAASGVREYEDGGEPGSGRLARAVAGGSLSESRLGLTAVLVWDHLGWAVRVVAQIVHCERGEQQHAVAHAHHASAEQSERSEQPANGKLRAVPAQRKLVVGWLLTLPEVHRVYGRLLHLSLELGIAVLLGRGRPATVGGLRRSRLLRGRCLCHRANHELNNAVLGARSSPRSFGGGVLGCSCAGLELPMRNLLGFARRMATRFLVAGPSHHSAVPGRASISPQISDSDSNAEDWALQIEQNGKNPFWIAVLAANAASAPLVDQGAGGGSYRQVAAAGAWQRRATSCVRQWRQLQPPLHAFVVKAQDFIGQFERHEICA
eukprot:COSAG06_NODE_2798_length_6269_cov_131.895948_4_plen_336_part_00